jgi:hypothetical protein
MVLLFSPLVYRYPVLTPIRCTIIPVEAVAIL